MRGFFGNNWAAAEYIERKSLRSGDMARKKPPLTGETYVYLHQQPVRTCELTPELKKRVATELTLTLLNTTFAGRAVFYSGQKCPPA